MHRFAGDRRILDAHAECLDQPAVRRNIVALAQKHDVAGHKLIRANPNNSAVPHDVDLLWQERQ